MGIRFTCPNGHQLHVKAFLAGKRGICPECDTKFIIPAASGGAVGLVEDGITASAEEITTGPGDVLSAPPTPPPLPGGISEHQTPDVWYVRDSSGDQYGPATAEIMRGWAEEGRVQADSLVWHAGWPAWKTGGEALELLREPIAPSVPETVAAAESHPALGSVTKRHQPRKRSRRDRAWVITIALSGLVLLLLIAVVLVVRSN